MATTVMDNIHGWFTPGTIHQAANLAGESDAKTESAIDGIASTILAGVWQKLSTVAGQSSIVSLISQIRSQGNIMRGLTEGLPQSADALASSGRSELNTIFGDRLDPVVRSISISNDISPRAATTLMSLAAPIVLSSLATEAGSQRLQSGTLSRILESCADWISRKVPAGLPSLLGMTNLDMVEQPVAERRAYWEEERPRRQVVAERPVARWFVPLLLGICLLGLLWYALSRQATRTIGTVPAPVTREPISSTTASTAPATTASLEQYLNNPSDTQVPKRFSFDYLNFSTGSTALTRESTGTVHDLANVMKAHPSTQVQLLGHTDSTGSAAMNLDLSTRRADAVRDLLVADGIPASRIVETRGIGEESPIASNDTSTGRAKNRRIELEVVTK